MDRTVAHDDNFPVVIVGGELQGQYTRGYVVSNFCIGIYTQDYSQVRAKGFVGQRKELDRQPKIPGYLGPMWDGSRLRYETSEVYKAISF